MALPIFQFLDNSLVQLQTQWSALLNPVIDALAKFNTKAPTQKTFLTGNGIYSTPSGIFYLHVRMCGGGGGGSGSSNAANNNGGVGNNGANTTFGSNLLIAKAGLGCLANNVAAFNGTGGVIPNNTSLSGYIVPGSAGGGPAVIPSTAGLSGGAGGNSGFGAGGGAGGAANGTAGSNAMVNTGGGGGGGGSPSNTAFQVGGGGSGAGYIDVIITEPLSSYPFTIGAGGTGGTAGTNGFQGGNGANGFIIVREYYQ